LKSINIKNKKAFFEYHILDKYTAGLELRGTEIKSIREGKATLGESYCFFIDNELWIKNMNIAEYKNATHYNHEPTRVRKLLLTSQELKKLQGKSKENNMTIIPLRLFISEKGWAKMEIAVAQGKKMHDKRDSIKKKDLEREAGRRFKN